MVIPPDRKATGSQRLGDGQPERLTFGAVLGTEFLDELAFDQHFAAVHQPGDGRADGVDAGFVAAEQVILHLYARQLDTIRPGNFQKDAKTRLQEWLQGRKKPLPRYQLLETSGAAHEQSFSVACEITQPAVRTLGTGSSRRIAEQNAAEAALKALSP